MKNSKMHRAIKIGVTLTVVVSGCNLLNNNKVAEMRSALKGGHQ